MQSMRKLPTCGAFSIIDNSTVFFSEWTTLCFIHNLASFFIYHSTLLFLLDVTYMLLDYFTLVFTFWHWKTLVTDWVWRSDHWNELIITNHNFCPLSKLCLGCSLYNHERKCQMSRMLDKIDKLTIIIFGSIPFQIMRLVICSFPPDQFAWGMSMITYTTDVIN